MQKQVRDIISIVQSFHAKLSVEFLTLQKDAYDQRSIMLLNYLSSREGKFAKILGKYLHDSDNKVLSNWIKVVPCLPVDAFSHCYNKLDIKPPLHSEDVLDIAIHYDDCLVEFFNTLVRESNFSDTETFFTKLLNNAIKEEKNLARDVGWLNDI